MGNLSCSAGNCVNNINGLCSANKINVAGISANASIDTQCETFSEKGFVNSFKNLSNMNLPGEIRQIFNNNSVQMSPEIKCSAINCVYNVNRVCNANDIVIYGTGAASSEGTQCETFRDK